MRDIAFELQEKGYANLKIDIEEESTIEFARRIGTVSAIPGVSTVQKLIPHAKEQASLNSYGSIYGLNQFPLHTDMAHWYLPPHYFLLRCKRPAPEVKTLILHSRYILVDEDELTLRRAIFRPRRPLDRSLNTLRLFEEGKCRWDPVFIVPITTAAMELRKRVLERLNTTAIEELSLEDSCDAILFDNWRVLHGRKEVPVASVHREIERVYLDSVHL